MVIYDGIYGSTVDLSSPGVIGGTTPAAGTFTTATTTTSVVTDTIAERTAAAGVTIDSVLLKDGYTQALGQVDTFSGNGNVSAAQMKGGFGVITGAYELELPTAAVGYSKIFQASTAAAYSLDVITGTDVIVLNGSALTAGYKATSDATIYNTMEVNCFVAGKYNINSLVGIATDGGA